MYKIVKGQQKKSPLRLNRVKAKIINKKVGFVIKK